MFLEKKNLRLTVYLPFILLCIGIPWFLFCIFLQYFSFEVWDEKSEYIENIGYLGGFISGATALVIVALTALAVYFSNKAYKQEIERVQQQRFEDHFFHLLEIHRENVKMMEINTLDGGYISNNKAILWMFRELVLIIEIFQIKYEIDINNANCDSKIGKFINYYSDEPIFKSLLDSVYIIEMAFYCFFFGAGKRSNRTLKYYLDERFSEKINVDELIRLLSNNAFRELVRNEKKFNYKIFGGHQTRLGHYYRHLYHTTKWIDTAEISENDKYEYYVKKLRIQLNTYEQALLAINSLTVFGSDWKKFIMDYKLIKNLPKNFFDDQTELGVEKILKEIQKDLSVEFDNYFEYQEQKIEKLQ